MNRRPRWDHRFMLAGVALFIINLAYSAAFVDKHWYQTYPEQLAGYILGPPLVLIGSFFHRKNWLTWIGYVLWILAVVLICAVIFKPVSQYGSDPMGLSGAYAALAVIGMAAVVMGVGAAVILAGTLIEWIKSRSIQA